VGTLASQAEIDIMGPSIGPLAMGVREYDPPPSRKNLESVYASFNLVISGRKMVRNAFWNTLTAGTSFLCDPTTFQQWERRSRALPSKWPLFQCPGQD